MDIMSCVSALYIYIYTLYICSLCYIQVSTPQMETEDNPNRVSKGSSFSPPSCSSTPYPSSSSSLISVFSQRDLCTPVTDDTMSVASSVSSLTEKEFTIPDIWRPSIMACIQAPSIEEKKKNLTVSVRGEISRDLVTQMYAFKQKPDRSFCTYVAKCLVKKYPFMMDTGRNVSGYVSSLYSIKDIVCRSQW